MGDEKGVPEKVSARRIWLAAAGELAPLLFVPPLFLAAGAGWFIAGRTRVAIAYFAARSALLMVAFAIIVFFILDDVHRDAETVIDPVARGVFYAMLIAAPLISAVVLVFVELKKRSAIDR